MSYIRSRFRQSRRTAVRVFGTGLEWPKRTISGRGRQKQQKPGGKEGGGGGRGIMSAEERKAYIQLILGCLNDGRDGKV